MDTLALWIGRAAMVAGGIGIVALLLNLMVNFLYNKIGDAVGLKKLWDGYNKSLEMEAAELGKQEGT